MSLRIGVGLLAVGLEVVSMGCSPGAASGTGTRNNLEAMEKAALSINQHAFEVWLAVTDQERELGLMQVTEEELASIAHPDGSTVQRGMLFAFEQEMPLSFWMRNTITPLDIAYIAPDGRIVKTYTMAPLETRIYPSIEPAQFALEVRAGLFAELGVGVGTYVQIPDSVLKRLD